ncbi:chemotaxis protein CheW [Cerasicoccus arenae]|uniref:Chemotaxis-related protein n=1 Tax=Cerasicoccus arenae TaxID=424488 RepID=A0A8J3DA59_9BACT|nr:chemotaxis protein CheW [Cerasicoccus arenae]MBK1859324.1 chemotaxis protein CheW [Cerasicoccus arenae]GHB93931.1 chemotaxis-related protein [Cerasicoccus arenae]
MLTVLFHLGDQSFAIDAECVEIVIPALPLRPVPGAPAFVGGRFEYRGRIIPVIDLGQLIFKHPLNEGLSSRYMLIQYKKPQGGTALLGLWAERVTETLEVSDDMLAEGGVSPPDARYLGRIFTSPDGAIVQCVETSDLLSAEVRDLLFNEPSAKTAP